MNQQINKWIKYGNSNPDSSFRLICFPHAGGSARYFLSWKKYFSGTAEISPVQLPARENRDGEIMPDSLREVAEQFVEQNQGLFDKAYALYGHSMGAIIAYEVAAEVKRKGIRLPQAIFVSGSVAPGDVPEERVFGNLEDKSLLEKVVDLKGTNKALLEDKGFLDYFLPVIRGDLTIYNQYVCTEPTVFDFPIYLFCGTNDFFATEEKMMGWTRYSKSKVTMKNYIGDHFFITDHAEAICSTIEENVKSIMRKGEKWTT